MNEASSTKYTALTIAVVLLSLVVAVQSFWMFQQSRALHEEAPSTPQKQNVPVEVPPPLVQQADPVLQAQPSPPAASRQDPWNDLFRTWDPLEEMDRMRQQMDQLFNDSFGRLPLAPNLRPDARPFSFAPNLDLEETPNAYIVRMNVPGAEEADVEVTLENNVLSVKGETEHEHSEATGQSLRRERRSGQFSRSVRLPDDLADDSFEAELQNGVLTVTIPRKPPLTT
jgi:HSP20 family protein